MTKKKSNNEQRREKLMEELEVGMTDWDEENEEVVVLRASSFAQPNVPAINDVTNMSKNPFIETYMKCI